jgi:hypothetical protein
MTVAPVLDYAAAERARLVNEARTALIASGTAVTVEMFARSTGRTAEGARQWLQRRRRSGELITVTYNDRVLIPTFQLTEAFDHDVTAGEIVKFFGERGMSDWAVWDWFAVPNTWLDGVTPAAALADGRVADVHRAAHGLFQE